MLSHQVVIIQTFKIRILQQKEAVIIYDFYRLSFRAKVGDFVDIFYLSRRINLIFDRVVNVKRDMMTLDDIKKLIENDEI